jgi:hypothetical protein
LADLEEFKDVDVFFAGDLEGRKARAALERGHTAFRRNFEAIIGLTYKSPNFGHIVKVDILDMVPVCLRPLEQTCLSSTKTCTASIRAEDVAVSEVTMDNLPWPTRDDLISMKALSASERFYIEKVRKDVADIEMLLEQQPGPLLFPGSTMAEANKAMVKELVPKLAQFSSRSETEWLERLGL